VAVIFVIVVIVTFVTSFAIGVKSQVKTIDD